MERLMKAQSHGDTSSLDFMRDRRVFEINPDHQIIRNLNVAFNNSPEDEEALRAIDLLYDAALVSSGYTPENPAELGGKIYEMMGMALSNKWVGPRIEVQESATQTGWRENTDAVEAEVVEPVQAAVEAEVVETESQK